MIGGVSRWTCPVCEREFARVHQVHTCAPGCTVDETFAGRPPVQRAIYDALAAHLATLGPVHVDAVSVGVFLKSEAKIAEVRPMAKAVSLLLIVPRAIVTPRAMRSARISGGRTVLDLRLASVDDVDDELRNWLTEAYDAATG
jgi:hypothetical protein